MNEQLETEISKFPQEIQPDLGDSLSKGGVISLEPVSKCLRVLNIEIGELMIKLLPLAKIYARVPISGFKVGAVALGGIPSSPSSSILAPGSLYLGSNMEFSGEALSFCIHGEQSATNNAWLNGEKSLQALAINAAPCGYCRQFLYELTTAAKLNRV